MKISGTGHRPNKLGTASHNGYSLKITQAGIRTIDRVIKEQQLAPSLILSGMALGFDQYLARWAIQEGVPFHALVPFEGFDAMWPQSSRDEFAWLLSQAQDVQHICEPGYAPSKMQKRNEALVDGCDLLLALWDGTSGGTANCLRYARRQHRPIVNVWDVFLDERARA